MTTTGADRLPIYERLVRERGDVLAEMRATAEAMQRQTADALDWRRLHQPDRRPQ